MEDGNAAGAITPRTAWRKSVDRAIGNTSISGGQRQLIGVARAFIRDDPTLVLDDRRRRSTPSAKSSSH